MVPALETANKERDDYLFVASFFGKLTLTKGEERMADYYRSCGIPASICCCQISAIRAEAQCMQP